MNEEWPDEGFEPEATPPSPRPRILDGRAALGGGAAYMAMPSLLSPLTEMPGQHYDAMAARRPIMSPVNTQLQDLAEFTRAEVQAIQDFARKQGVTAPILSAGPGAPSSFVEAQPLAGKINRIGLGRASVPSAMHEIGHASPILGSTKLRDTSFIANAMAKGLPGKILRGAILANILRGKSEGDSELADKAYDYAPALMGATYAPMLLEEARATGHAIKGGRAIGKGLETFKELMPGYGTYAAKALTPVLAALVAKKVVEALRNMNRGEGQEKEASTVGAEVKAPGILREGASAAWRMSPPSTKPKTTKPSTNPSVRAKESATLKPPSSRSYYKDMIESLHNPQRGFRITKPS